MTLTKGHIDGENVHISNSTEPTHFFFGTYIQQHKIHLTIKVLVTLTKAEGHR